MHWSEQSDENLAGDNEDRKLEGVAEHLPPQRVGQQIGEILEPDKDAALADGGVGEGQPDTEAERVGEEYRQQTDRRCQAHRDQERLVVEQARDHAGLPGHDVA